MLIVNEEIENRAIVLQPVVDQRGKNPRCWNRRSAGRLAGTIADAARIPIATAAKTTTRSHGEIILVVVLCSDRSILSVVRIPLDLTSLRSCPASRRVHTRRPSLRRESARTVTRIVTELRGACMSFFVISRPKF